MNSADFKNLLVCEDETVTVTVNAKELQEYILAHERRQFALNKERQRNLSLNKTIIEERQRNSLLQALLDEKKSKQIHVDLRV